MMIGSFVFATRPHRRVRARTIPFESGVSEGPPKRQRFTVSFYLTAMLFILFDIEIVFLYPLAVILHELSCGTRQAAARVGTEVGAPPLAEQGPVEVRGRGQ